MKEKNVNSKRIMKELRENQDALRSTYSKNRGAFSQTQSLESKQGLLATLTRKKGFLHLRALVFYMYLVPRRNVHDCTVKNPRGAADVAQILTTLFFFVSHSLPSCAISH